MDVRKLLIASSFAVLPVAGVLAAERDARSGTDATATAVAALRANLGNATGLEIDEVRMTQDGVACIDYRLTNGSRASSLGHAVVQGDQVLKSSDDKLFEKAWNEHCLGPRGGMPRVE